MSGIKCVPIIAGTTSHRAQVWIRDSSVSYDKGLTGLVYNTASLTAYYWRNNGVVGIFTPIAITLVTATVGTWTSSGFKEIDATNMPGLYEIGIPDALLATGSTRVTLMLKGAANMVQTVTEFELYGNDPYSAAFSSGANDGIASAVGAMAVETGVSVIQMLRAIGAVAAGNYTDSTKVFEAVGAATTTRVTTALSSNNRTNTLNL